MCIRDRAKTRSRTVVNPGDPCRMGCEDVGQVVLLDDNILVRDTPCAPVLLPFIATDNRIARLALTLSHDAQQRVNSSLAIEPAMGMGMPLVFIDEVEDLSLIHISEPTRPY
eukprot:TRINITY_DN15934_c0_g1_i1.p1 TRINITY_DN15934_c0_g1~~TRINITY_DN15934_c0_g1_i1.p1  ORF type:complete len:112 (+),score=8.17 TRINITY_DN15934_c0_g1_i1:60-395(+)